MDSSYWILRSARLSVTIARPGTVYTGSRFDWTGFITQVMLDDAHVFCTPEAIDDTGTGGIGLCNEYGIRSAVGFSDANAGEQFVKPGIGLLTRPDKSRYQFHRPYAIQPFPIEVDVASDRIHFVAHPLPCRGYALQTTKTIRVTDAGLRIEYGMLNVGERPVQVEEYCHNFLAINGTTPSADLMLRLPFDALPPVRNSTLVACEQGLFSWQKPPCRAFIVEVSHLGRNTRGAEAVNDRWALEHAPSGVTISETTSVPWSRFSLFVTSRLLSPEAFIAFRLYPGKRYTWSREYQFSVRAQEPTMRVSLPCCQPALT